MHEKSRVDPGFFHACVIEVPDGFVVALAAS
jgi:hypothetical protein